MKGQFPSKDTQFSKENQPRKNGRKKGLLFTTILKKMIECDAPEMVTNNEYVHSYIEENIAGRKLSHQEMIVLKLIHSAEVNGDMQAIKEILNRIDGTVTENIDMKSGGEKITQLPPINISLPNNIVDILKNKEK